MLRRVCAYCDRERCGEDWLVRPSPDLDVVSHGICPECERASWMREFGRPREPEPELLVAETANTEG
jgi:hypothetical protein